MKKMVTSLWLISTLFFTNTQAQADTLVSITPSPVASPAIGEQLVISVSITDGVDVKAYDLKVAFDNTALRYVSAAPADYLPEVATPSPTVLGNRVRLAGVTFAGVGKGDGVLATITFEVVAVKASTLTLLDVLLADSDLNLSTPETANGQVVEPTQPTEPTQPPQPDPGETPVVPMDATVRISPASVESPAIGAQFTVSLEVVVGANVAGYQATVQFDTTALRYVSSANGDYLPAGAFVVPAVLSGNAVILAATALSGESEGDGTLATVTFEVVSVKASTLTLSDVVLSDSAGVATRPQLESGQVVEPAENGPGVEPPAVNTVRISPASVESPAIGAQFTVSLEVVVGANVAGYQATVQFDTTALRYVSSANGDYLPAGAFVVPAVVSGNQVTLAATALSGESEGDGTLATVTFEVIAVKASTLTLSDVVLSDSAGAATRPQLENGQVTVSSAAAPVQSAHPTLAAVTPQESALLPNYPNPFNPETWIPYHLTHDAAVTLTVYDAHGALVRRLDLGHQPAGYYTDRSKAAYWDGRNASGEPVTSGVYFYQFQAGDFSATRRMVILK